MGHFLWNYTFFPDSSLVLTTPTNTGRRRPKFWKTAVFFVIDDSRGSHIVPDVLDHNFSINEVADDKEAAANRKVLSDSNTIGDHVVTTDEKEIQHTQNTVVSMATAMSSKCQ